MRIIIDGDMAYIYTPYNTDFVAKIKKINAARWEVDKKAWRVPVDYIDAVREIMLDVYGKSDIAKAPGKRYDVRLTFHKDIYAERNEVTIYGRCVAGAYGNKSGGHAGGGVCYIKGGPASGGSAKHWYSMVREGSVVMLYDIPESMICLLYTSPSPRDS